MRIEYVLSGIIVLMTLGGIGCYRGSRLWGKIEMTKGQRIFFRLYLLVNRLKLFGRKKTKIALLLHLIKIYKEIALLEVQFNRAKEIFDSRTKYELIDIYDDCQGHRYIKMRTKDQGDVIFEIEELIYAALKKSYLDGVLEAAPEDANEETITELRRRPVLKLMK